MIDLDHLQRLDNAAFPAPWSVVMSHGHDFWRTIYSENNRYQIGTFDDDLSTSYIVALRNAAPALFAEVRRLRAIEAAARAYVDLDARMEAETPSHYLFARLQAALAAKE